MGQWERERVEWIGDRMRRGCKKGRTSGMRYLHNDIMAFTQYCSEAL